MSDLTNPATPEAPVYDQRATFYFSADQLLELEVRMLHIRTQQRVRVGKSDLMRLALDNLLAMPVEEVAAHVKATGK